MKPAYRVIDHIVYCVPDLDTAIDKLERQLGIRPVYGGSHQMQGTHNALLDLGESCYLEILAVDSDNQTKTADRWMGIDLISQPTVTRWALKSDDLVKDQHLIRQYDKRLAHKSEGSRVTASGQRLTWQMILPQPRPLIELVPFMVDWSQSEIHPCDGLKAGCLLTEIELKGPANGDRTGCLSEILEEDLTVLQADSPQISITVKGPNGTITL